ncbi:hypothetical protein [Leucobacter sp. wl10]|uniref:hypothetical protein n=1 Tax=Leucobacter sp. wl10 TaxID=2304677 RepID=UPI0013C35CB6|nr:hypothetical protein [Leucobacter sp. wl10]
MSLIQTLIELAVRTLPAPLQARYREEWAADLEQASQLGISRVSVLSGAFATSARLDRDDPRVTGIPSKVETIRRARWSAAFLCSALILAAGTFAVSLTSADQHLNDGVMAVSGTVTFATIAVFALIGIVNGIGAVRIGLSTFGLKRIAQFVLFGIAAVLSMAVTAVFPILGVLMAPAAVATALFLAAGGPRGQLPQQPLRTVSRIGLSAMFSLLAICAVAFATLHILVWNPLAKMPGMSLSEIYAAMYEAEQPTGVAVVAVWAGLFIAAAIAFPICCSLRRFAGPRSTRRIIVTGAMLITAVGVTQWFAGFTIGMSLADTFFVSGGDSAASGVALSVITTLAAVFAVFASFVPTPWRDAEQRYEQLHAEQPVL